MIKLRVDGLPQPKGSKSGFIRSSAVFKDGRGTWHLNPRVVIAEGRRTKDPTKGAAGFDHWKRNVKATAVVYKTVNRHEPYAMRPLQLEAWFFLPRPASLPKRVEYPMTKPDLEKLVRAIMDELQGLIYDNDSRFIDHYTHKRFADREHPIGVEITINAL